MTNETVIESINLSKEFREVKAVDNLNLKVHKGDVFGFLGPNGAGKSTTIRMLLTLISPTSGSIKLFGEDLRKKRIELLRKVGAIVEKPDFYNYLSAYKNLEILAKITGAEVKRKEIMSILELVGLEKRYRSKVKTFSHGMKQRLGIAQALLHKPELIILDEPTTGLDPQGMKEIRDLIVFLSREEGKTIFLSSHILHEVELVANRMIIIDKGSARVEGEVKDLLNKNSLKVTFEVDDSEAAKRSIANMSWINNINSAVNNKIIFTISPGEISALNKHFVENEISVNAIIPTRSLEEYFLSITEKGTG